MDVQHIYAEIVWGEIHGLEHLEKVLKKYVVCKYLRAQKQGMV